MYKPNAKQLFFISIALQAIFLIGLIVVNQLTLVTGTEILLRTEPIDPRSLFQGDYVILRYGISTIRLADVSISEADAAKLDDGMGVYVTLEPAAGEKYYEPVAVSLDKPQSGIAMRGKINYVNFARSETDCVLNDCVNQDPKPVAINLKYGIESYFVPEGKGRELEQINRRGRAPLLVGVAVDGNGRGLIKSLVIDENSIDAADINQVVETASSTVNIYESQRQRTEADSELTTLMRDISDALQEYRNQQYVYPAKGQGLPPYDALAKIATGDHTRFQYLKARADNLKGNIVWLDNSNYADGYCAFAQSVRDPQVWYLIDSNIAIIDTPPGA